MPSLLQNKIKKHVRLIYSNTDFILFRYYFPVILQFISSLFPVEKSSYSCKSAGLASLRPMDFGNSPLLPYNNCYLPLYSFMDLCIGCRLHPIFFTSWISERRQSVTKRLGQRRCPNITLHRKLTHFSCSSTHIFGILLTYLQNFSESCNYIAHRSRHKHESSCTLGRSYVYIHIIQH